jgi:protein-S-isoprenylcysteine O-methyltransferase Ste14
MGFAARGGWLVVAQFVLMGATLALGFLPPRWPDAIAEYLAAAGAFLAFCGAVVAYFAAHELGRALTPFPAPSRRGSLVDTGPYRFVRHPIYAAGLLFFAGYAVFAGPLALVGVALLAILWAHKATVEERFLQNRYDGYAGYEDRVRWRLFPGVW